MEDGSSTVNKGWFKKGHRGYNSTLGRKHTEETKAKISDNSKQMWSNLRPELKEKLLKNLSHRGPEYKHPMKGKHLSEDHKQKISNSLSGYKSYWYGKHLSDEHKAKIRKIHLGIPESKETREKDRIASTGRHHTQITKDKMREIRLNRIFPQKDTKPELMAQEVLDNLGIVYTKHKSITGQPDLYIEKTKTAIFIDGCYWHGCPQHHTERNIKKNYYKDFRIKQELELEGHQVIRVYEHELPDFVNILKATSVIK